MLIAHIHSMILVDCRLVKAVIAHFCIINGLHFQVVGALANLVANNSANQNDVREAGGIPPLVALLQPGTAVEVAQQAAPHPTLYSLSLESTLNLMLTLNLTLPSPLL